MTALLGVLHLEDDVHDAALIQDTLEMGGFTCEVTRVETEPAFVVALERGGFDVILADYTLPSFDGVRALRLAREHVPLIPFIFVSGTLGEDVAIEALKNGATDYVFKTRLSRMIPAVRRALREAEERSELSQAEQALRRSEIYLTAAQGLSHTGSFGWNPVTGDIVWSLETYRIFDIDPDVVVTLNRVLERVYPDDRHALQEQIDRLSSGGATLDFEHRLLMPDGKVKHIHVLARPATDENGCSGYVGAVQDITERKRAERAVRRARIREVKSRYTAMMEERTRLAREIHDTLLQGFAGVTLMVAAAAGDVRDPALAAVLAHVFELAERTLREARHAVWDLRDSSRENDLITEMRLEADKAVRETGLGLELVTDGAPRPIDAKAHEVILRVMREAITNAVRHANATRVVLRLSFRPRTVRLSVSDDGVGFIINRDFESYGNHWGLRGMSERAAELGARLSVRSYPGDGTEVLLVVRDRSGTRRRPRSGPPALLVR